MICYACKGSGIIDKSGGLMSNKLKCKTCNGSGKIESNLKNIQIKKYNGIFVF